MNLPTSLNKSLLTLFLGNIIEYAQWKRNHILNQWRNVYFPQINTPITTPPKPNLSPPLRHLQDSLITLLRRLNFIPCSCQLGNISIYHLSTHHDFHINQHEEIQFWTTITKKTTSISKTSHTNLLNESLSKIELIYFKGNYPIYIYILYIL